jgi:hypothetical protein
MLISVPLIHCPRISSIWNSSWKTWKRPVKEKHHHGLFLNEFKKNVKSKLQITKKVKCMKRKKEKLYLFHPGRQLIHGCRMALAEWHVQFVLNLIKPPLSLPDAKTLANVWQWTSRERQWISWWIWWWYAI